MRKRDIEYARKKGRDYGKAFGLGAINPCFLCGQDKYKCSLEVLYEDNGEICEELVCEDCIQENRLSDYKRELRGGKNGK